MSAIALGTAAIAATATIAVGVIKDKTQRKQNNDAIEIMKQDQRLKELDEGQKRALDYRVANAKTDTERLAIYEETLSKLGTSTIGAISNIYSSGVATKSKQNYLTKSVVLAGGIMLIGGTIAVIRKK